MLRVQYETASYQRTLYVDHLSIFIHVVSVTASPSEESAAERNHRPVTDRHLGNQHYDGHAESLT